MMSKGGLELPSPSGNERQQAAGSGEQRHLATGRAATCRALAGAPRRRLPLANH